MIMHPMPYNLLLFILNICRTISLILEDLSDISKDMRDELDCQNELIADTIKQSTSVTEELQSANRLTKYFL